MIVLIGQIDEFFHEGNIFSDELVLLFKVDILQLKSLKFGGFEIKLIGKLIVSIPEFLLFLIHFHKGLHKFVGALLFPLKLFLINFDFLFYYQFGFNQLINMKIQ